MIKLLHKQTLQKIYLAILFLLIVIVGTYFINNKNQEILLPLKNNDETTKSITLFPILETTSSKKELPPNSLYYEATNIFKKLSYDIIIQFPNEVKINTQHIDSINSAEIEINNIKYYLYNLNGWAGGFPPCAENDELCNSETTKIIELNISTEYKPTLIIWSNKEGAYKLQFTDLATTNGLNKKINNNVILNNFYISKNPKEPTTQKVEKFSKKEIEMWKNIIEVTQFKAILVK